jgi:hypothetical protein
MYRSLLLALAALPLAAAPASAQVADLAPPASGEVSVAQPVPPPPPEHGFEVLYDNGPVLNSVGSGLDGADESILQSVTLGTGIFGFGAGNAGGLRIADDFTVPTGETWDVDSLIVYGYQTLSGNTSTLNGAFVEIFDGDPNAGGTVIHGDQTTNVLLSSEWTNVYRVTETTTGANSDRPIMDVVAELDVELTEGTYWLVYSFTGDGAFSGPWSPPIEPVGTCYPGNAQQFNAGAWAQLENINTTNQTGCFVADGFGVEMPFVLLGTRTGTAVEAGPSLPGEFALAAPTPNPAGGVARVGVTVERAQVLVVEVYDALGRRVAVAYDGPAAVGALDVRVDTGALPNGVYVVRATGERGAATQALTVAH